MNGFLLAKQELLRKHIERTPNCEVCGANEESTKHVLLDCIVVNLF